MSALMAPCGECGERVWSDQFHDYVECVRRRLLNVRLEPTQALRDIASLLAYIDSKEPDRLSKAHPLYHGEAELVEVDVIDGPEDPE